MAGPISLRVADLKQYAYCPRVVYYQYLMPVGKKTTFKMECGKSEELRIDRLEKRRKFHKYGLAEGKRLFHQGVSSDRLGLSGKIDMLIEKDGECFPVDFKFTSGRPHKNHVYQLCGYALILEDIYKKEISTGFVYLIPADDAVAFDLTHTLKEQALAMANEIRGMLLEKYMPPAVENRNKCIDCEYRNYCGDVF